MAKKVVLGGLLAGILVFFWGAFAHMVLPLGRMGVRQIPDEEPVRSAMRDTIREPGFYFVPGKDMSKEASESEDQVWLEKVKQGPVGVLIVRPSGGEAMSARQLGTELATNVVSALLAAFLLTSVRSGYWARPVRDRAGRLRVPDDQRAVLELVRLPLRLHRRRGHRSGRRLVPRGPRAGGRRAMSQGPGSRMIASPGRSREAGFPGRRSRAYGLAGLDSSDEV